MRYIALMAIIFLSGFSAFSKNAADFSCPRTGLLDNTSTLTLLAPGSAKDVVAVAAIKGFSGDCSLSKDKKTIEISLKLPFLIEKGAAGANLKDEELPYFIAVLSPVEEILQRQAFMTKISFDNSGTGSAIEEHVIRVPLKPQTEGHQYNVVIGFALTRDQLKYNEEHK